MKDTAITISFATGCAWRAVYIRIAPIKKHNYSSILTGCPEYNLLTLGIDPDFTRPQWFFGAFDSRVRHFRLPHLRWGYRRSFFKPWLWLYRKQNAFLHSLDGRFREARP